MLRHLTRCDCRGRSTTARCGARPYAAALSLRGRTESSWLQAGAAAHGPDGELARLAFRLLLGPAAWPSNGPVPRLDGQQRQFARLCFTVRLMAMKKSVERPSWVA